MQYHTCQSLTDQNALKLLAQRNFNLTLEYQGGVAFSLSFLSTYSI